MSDTQECPGCGETLALQDDVCNLAIRECRRKFPMEYVHANGTPFCDQENRLKEPA